MLLSPVVAALSWSVSLSLSLSPVVPPAVGRPLPLERLQQDPPLEGKAPTGVQIAPGGALVTFLRGSAADSEVLDLWSAAVPAPGQPTTPAVLVRASDLLGGKDQKLTEQEKMALERKRISKRGITSYRFCGDDGQALLFPFSGDLYRVALNAAGAPPAVQRLTSDDDVPEIDPTCSKSGRLVSFVKGGDVYVIDATQKTPRAKKLTQGGSATRSFGTAEFIAAEEMGRTEGMWWSPDDKTLLVFEVDESPVGVKMRPQIFADRTELFEQRYPAAGEKNALVNAWLVDVKSGKKRPVKLPPSAQGDGYLARGGFFDAGAAMLQWQSRDQRRLQLLEVDVKTGQAKLVHEERDDVWVDLHDDFVPLPDRRFLWSSEQSGARQLLVLSRDQKPAVPVTRGGDPVVSVCGVDDQGDGSVVYVAAVDRGREQHVFRATLAPGSGGGAATKLTGESPWNQPVCDDDARVFLNTRSAWGVPNRVALHDGKTGAVLFVLDDNPATELSRYAKSQPQWLEVKTRDGDTLNAQLLPPVNLKPGQKHPVIVYVYGGPTGQTVAKRWARQFPLFTHWTQQGFGVFLVDNRGMGQRGRAFSRAVHQRLGDIEVQDVHDAVAALKETAWVDGERLGVYGWSYGGYLASRLVLDDKSPFAAAAAVAPVTDWTLYDTHYTERYLGLPVVEGKPAPAYASSNLVTRAPQLSRPLLLVHGTADDNVLFEHTLRLVSALEDNGKLFDLAIYPGKAHGIAGKTSQLHVHKTITAYFQRTLRPPR